MDKVDTPRVRVATIAAGGEPLEPSRPTGTLWRWPAPLSVTRCLAGGLLAALAGTVGYAESDHSSVATLAAIGAAGLIPPLLLALLAHRTNQRIGDGR